MNLYLNEQSILESVMDILFNHLHIHCKVTIFWRGEEIGVLTRSTNQEKTFIVNEVPYQNLMKDIENG